MKHHFSREQAVAIKAALRAGALIKKKLNTARDIRFKGAIDIVTDADLAAERCIIGLLKRAFPHDGVMAEESPQEHGARTWIIDPLDGTTNFSRRFPFFCVSIALEIDGAVALGVVYDPVHEELFCAERGCGALCNKKRIRVSSTNTLKTSFLATGFAYDFKTAADNNFAKFQRMMMASMAIRRAGAAALDLCYVACGRFDGFWELDLKPWDMAAAALIIQEAGGTVSDVTGGAHDIYGKSLAASNGLIHQAMVDILSREQEER